MQISTLLAAPARSHIHLVGIGGSGLSAIARVLLQRGLRVSGSDQRASQATADLAALGATVFSGHAAAHIQGADLVLISSAVPADNPEVAAAHAAGIPVVKREQFLAPLLAEQSALCVAGTHGKTTTSAMLAALLDALGAEPGFIVGSTVLALGTAARAGRIGGPFVIEADEYDHMFLGLNPAIAVITNIEWDHVDCYPKPEDFAAAFRQFVERLTPGGTAVICGDDAGCRALRATTTRPDIHWLSYGLEADNHWRAEGLRANALGGMDFDIYRGEERLGQVAMPLAGEHNVRNALAALATATLAGYDVFCKPDENLKFSRIFVGTKRRLETIGGCSDIIIIDDYAHHPTEVRATLGAARQRFPRRPLWVFFQPHTYSRTKALLNEFCDSFENADHVLVGDIYAAREHDTLGVSAADVVNVLAAHPDVRYAGSLAHARDLLVQHLSAGDVLITLGAGDGDRVGREVLAALCQQQAASTAATSWRDDLSRAIAQATGLAVRHHEALAAHTTLRVGGPADLFVAAGSTQHLAAILDLARAHGVPVTLLGGGSNVLVSDLGVRGLVIANTCRSVRQHQGNVLWAEAGAPLAGTARQAMRWGLGGLEWAVSVPGSVGGALAGNAGAHGGCIADSLLRATMWLPDGSLAEWPAARFDYHYRSSVLKQATLAEAVSPVVLAAAFQLQPGDQATLEARAAGFLAHRRSTQPTEPSAGSIFQNPAGDYAGRIIEALGLKGARHGDAQFSLAHANFIINRGHANAQDIAALINRARQEAWQTFGILLTPEILFIGDWPQPPLAEVAA